MKNLKRASSVNGFSFVEVMVASGILAVIVFAISEFIIQQKRSARSLQRLEMRLALQEDILDDLSSYGQCKDFLLSGLGISDPASTMGNSNSVTLNANAVNAQYANSFVNIERATLVYNDDTVANAQNTTLNSGTTYNRYNATLMLELEDVRDKVTNAVVGAGDRGVYLKAITVPLTMTVPSTRRWADMKCTTQKSATLAIVGEICAHYGGELNESFRCMFKRTQRRDYGSIPPNNVPIASTDATTGVVRRVPLSDVMCYIDTLTTLIPYSDWADNLRQYRKDYFPTTAITRFCKRPGRVVQSSPGGSSPININSRLNQISSQARGYLQNP